MNATVKYQVGKLAGTIQVPFSPEESDQSILLKAKKALMDKYRSLPYGTEQWKVIDKKHG